MFLQVRNNRQQIYFCELGWTLESALIKWRQNYNHIGRLVIAESEQLVLALGTYALVTVGNLYNIGIIDIRWVGKWIGIYYFYTTKIAMKSSIYWFCLLIYLKYHVVLLKRIDSVIKLREVGISDSTDFELRGKCYCYEKCSRNQDLISKVVT